jgi:hypothetical protein
MNIKSSIVVLLSFFICNELQGQNTNRLDQAGVDFFETKIRPVLVDHCYKCHSADSKIIKGGLRVDNRQALIKGGDSGSSIVPGDPTKSLLIKALKYDGLEMPPKGRLSDSVIKDFETWIKMGAADPRKSVENPIVRTLDIEAGRKHWAFQPILDPKPPLVKDAAWPLDPLDRFLLARLENAGLQPSKDADRHTWLRRVSFDLTGLPPSPSEIKAFIKDNSPQAWEKVVDRLLGSHAYGERWARHWLDLTGYADMMGTSNNVYAEHAWRYRDYLIAAYNKDKPFDRFVKEQIAGDLIPANKPEERAENLTATGFLMVGDVEIVEPDKAKLEADYLDTQISKIGTAFLGMTLGCVRCHDHKFDPIGLQDYYGIAGMLRSSPSTHKTAFGVWSSLNTTDLPETPEHLKARQKLESKTDENITTWKDEKSSLEMQQKTVAQELAQLDKAASPDKKADAPTAAKREALVKKRDELNESIRKIGGTISHAEFFRSKAPKAFALKDGDSIADMPVYIRGNPYAPGVVMPRAAIRVVSRDKFPTIPQGQSGRLQLADWLADASNPLTARVAVNRIWQKLFGEGIVSSVDYFGTRGETPSHPELLDHLATRFMNQGWSQKRLMHDLVLSHAYRMASSNNQESMKIDPENKLVWRMNRQRLDAEAIRDGLLHISGELIQSDGGPSLVLEEPENCGSLSLKGVNPPNYTHRKPRPTEEFQRTIYLPVMRTNFGTHDRIRSFFDFVNPAQIAGQRNQTVVPTQSLFVMNNDLFQKRARLLATRVLAEFPDTKARLNYLWLAVFNRPITNSEYLEAAEFLGRLPSSLNAKDSKALDLILWQELSHSLLASNEFIFRF